MLVTPLLSYKGKEGPARVKISSWGRAEMMMRKGVLSLISIFAFLQAVSAQETKEGEA